MLLEQKTKNLNEKNQKRAEEKKASLRQAANSRQGLRADVELGIRADGMCVCV